MPYRKILSVAGLSLILITPNANADLPTNGLVGYWTGNGNANDTSTIGNNGVFDGNYAAGINGGQAFDLSTGIVTIQNNPAYTFGSSFSVGFWFNLNGTNPNGNAFLGQDFGSGSNPKWFIDYNNGFGAIVYPNANYFLSSNNGVSIPDGWNQLTVVDNNNTFTWYLNGANLGSDTTTSLPNPSAPLILGYAEPGLAYAGLMSNVSLYNTALTSSDVQNLANPLSYTSAVPVPSAIWLFSIGLGLLGYKGRKQ